MYSGPRYLSPITLESLRALHPLSSSYPVFLEGNTLHAGDGSINLEAHAPAKREATERLIDE